VLPWGECSGSSQPLISILSPESETLPYSASSETRGASQARKHRENPGIFLFGEGLA
jgi:hypothetical protein